MSRSFPKPALLAAVAATCALFAPARADAVDPVKRQQLTVNGDFTIFGNTLAHDCGGTGATNNPIVTPIVGTVTGCTTNNVYTDDSVDFFWQSGAGSADANGTISAATSQSTAVLGLPATATVKFARLYWAGRVDTEAYDPDATLVTPDGVSHPVTADRGVVITRAAGEYWYQSSAPVTDIIGAAAPFEPRGAYTFSGAASWNFVGQNALTSFNSWWIVVFYQDSADPNLRQLTLFDGLSYVDNANDANVTLTGFLVPGGGWDAKLGVITYEGDARRTGDSLLFQGYVEGGPVPGTLTTLVDCNGAANNFFNGTRCWLGSARTVVGDLPQMSGALGSMMGFDMDVVDLKAANAIAAGDTAAVITATSNSDAYALGAFVTSINTLRPSFIETIKSSVNLNPARPDSAFPGDVVEYTIDTANTGNDPSIQTVLEDPLPAGVTFVPGSLRIVSGANAGTKTDGAGDDEGEYDSATRKITVRLGTGADAWVGGMMAIGEAAQIKFQATVDAGAAGLLLNQASVAAAGENGEPLRTFPSSPPSGSGATPLPIDACLTDAHCGGSTPACFTTPTPNVCVGCTSDGNCADPTPVCDLTAHRCVGRVTIAPLTQSKSTVAGVGAPFAMTLTNNLPTGDTYDLDVTDPGCGWTAELRTSVGAIVGSRSAAGAWTVAPGIDTNGNGQPDLGATGATGGTTDFVLWLIPQGATTTCTATVVATGDAFGETASAQATLAVAASAATWTPDHTGANAQAVPPGGDVGFPGVIRNHGATALDFTLAASVTATPAAGTLAPHLVYSDPNGDGDWSDGAAISSTGTLAPYGGSVHVVLVLRAATSAGNPLPIGTRLDATATATNGGTVATQLDEAIVHYAATYADPGRVVAQGRFAPCDTVYLGAEGLPSGTYTLEWYAKASPVRGTDTPFRSVPSWTVSGGSGLDQVAIPAIGPGTWTILVIQTGTPDVIRDTLTFQVENAGLLALAVPARIPMTGGLSVASTARNDNVSSTFANSRIAYVVTDDGGTVWMDGTGAFGATPATAHTTSSVTVAAGATGSDAWASGSPAWPAPGLYHVDAEWRLQCGSVPYIAPATAAFQVAPDAPIITSPTGTPTFTTSTPTIEGTGFPGASVTVTAGGASCTVDPVPAGGSWSCTLAPALGDGPHSVIASQAFGGATSDDSAAAAFNVDATTSVAITAPAAGATLNGTAAPNGDVTLTGTMESGATVTLTVDGAAVAVTPTGPTTWTATATGLSDAAHTAVATATDTHANTATASRSFTVDARTSVTITAPAAGATLNGAAAPGGVVPVSGTAEAETTVAVTIGATTKPGVLVDTLWDTDFTLADGAYTVTAEALDGSGNTATATVGFTVDARTVTFSTPGDGETLNSSVASNGDVTFSGTTEADGTVVLTVDGVDHVATLTGTTWSVTVNGLADAGHSATVAVSDALGNLATASITFIVDARTSVAITAPASGSTLSSSTAPNGDVTFTGTMESGATVTLTVDGAAVAVTATGATTWTATANGLSDAAHTAVATATDVQLNTATATVSLTVDARTSVAITAPADGSTLNSSAAPNGDVTFTGTNESGATVTLTVDGAAVAVTPTSATAWTATATGLTDAGHVAVATGTDVQANTATATVSFTVAVRTTVAITAPASGSTLNGTTAPNGNVTFTGTMESGATVTLTVDGAAVAVTPTGATTWTATANGLSDAAHTAVATATDVDGNTATATVSFTVDARTSVAITAPADGSTLSSAVAPGGNVTFSGTNESGATVTLTVDGASVAITPTSATAWTATATGLSDAAHVALATATDVQANTATATVGFTVDARTSVAITAPGDGTTLDSSVAPNGDVTFSGTMESGATVTLTVDGAAVAVTPTSATAWTATATGLSDAAHVAVATATDVQLNTATATVSFTVDARTSVAITAPADGATVNAAGAPGGDVTFSGTTESGATVSVGVDGGAAVAATVTGTTWTVTVTGLSDAAHVAVATATDAEGNTATATVSITLDANAPAAPVVTAPAPGSTPSEGTIVFTGTAEPGSTVTVTVDGTSHQGVAGADGSFAIPVGLPDGSWTATVSATDAAGNASPATSLAFQTLPLGGEVSGGGGCSCGPAGGANPASLLLLSLALPFLPRRRRPAARQPARSDATSRS